MNSIYWDSLKKRSKVLTIKSKPKSQPSMDLLNCMWIVIVQHRFNKLQSSLHTDSTYSLNQDWPRSQRDWLTMLPRHPIQSRFKSSYVCGSLTGVSSKRELTWSTEWNSNWQDFILMLENLIKAWK